MTMELAILNLQAQQVGAVTLPRQFEEPIRPDLIRRAFEAARANARQPYGSDPRAGKRASARLPRRRRKYKTAYGKGISRVPRKTILHRGSQFIWIGAFAPSTVGGRRAHPPKAQKIWSQKINDKERRKALRSALAATLLPALVQARGHALPKQYPVGLSFEFEALAKAKAVRAALETLGFSTELERASRKHVRPGKGKLRGRRYKRPVGPLLVVSGECPLARAARNIPGIDVVPIQRLSAVALAPGSHPGRLTLFTQPALERLAKEGLYA